jgi:hypothetical protein
MERGARRMIRWSIRCYPTEFLVPAGFFVLFVAIASGCFFFEARKARRLIEAALGKGSTQ